MGAIVSKELVSPFDAFGNWKYEEAVQMQNEYKEKDYDFGIDHSVIQQLCKAVRKNIPSSLGQDILKSFSKSNSGIINALSLIGGVILVSQHSDNGTVVSQKSEAIFDAFDFEGEGDISLDEMTICLLSVLRAVSVMTGRESEPTDQGMEELCLEAFGQFQLDAQDYIQKGQFAKWAASKVDATTSATGILKTFELLDKEARTRRNSRMTPRNGGAPYDGVDAKSQPVDAAEVQRLMSQTAPSRLPTPVAQGGGAGLPAAASSSSNFTYQAPSMAQLKAVATKYQQRLPQPGDPRYYRKAGAGGGEAPGLKAPVAVPAKARKASVHKSEPVFVSHKKEGAASSAGAYQPRAGLNLAAVYQAPSMAQLKAVGSKYALRLPQPGDRRFYQKAAAAAAAAAQPPRPPPPTVPKAREAQTAPFYKSMQQGASQNEGGGGGAGAAAGAGAQFAPNSPFFQQMRAYGGEGASEAPAPAKTQQEAGPAATAKTRPGLNRAAVYQAPGMAQLKAVATKYQQRLPQPGDPRYYRKAGAGGGEVPGLKAPVAVPAKARKASVHKSEPVFVSHKKEGAASSAGAYQPRAGVNPAAVYQAPTIAQLKAVGTKYVQRLPQAGDSRYYQKAAIQKQPAASASEFVFEMEAGQAGDESFNPATQSVVEEPMAAEVQKEMAKDRPVTAPSYKARAGLNPASVYQAPSMAQLKAVATKYQQRLPQPGDPRYYRKAGTGGGEVPGLKAPVAVPAKARKASVHKSEPVFVSHKKEGAASSAGAYQPRAGLNLAAVYQAPSIAQLKAVGSKYALRLPQPGDRRFYQKAKATAAAGAAATTMVPVQAFADRKASLAPTLGPAPVAGATHVAAAAAALPSVVPLKPQPSRRDPFPRGLPVTANFCGLGWRSAKVLSVNANGTLNLLYTHGAKEVYVSTKVVGPPFSSFISHQVYTTMKPPLQLSSMRSTPSHIVSTPSSLTVAPLKNSCEPKSFRTPDGKVWYSSFVSHQTYQPPQRPSGPKSFQTPDGKVWYSSFVSHQTYQPPQKPSGPKSFRTPDGKVWYSSFVSHQTYQPPQKPSEPQSFRTPDGKVWYSSFVSHQTYCATKLPARSNEYTVGLPVTANFCGLGWRSAKVAEVNPNGTLNLLYTHGAKEVHVSKKAVRPPFSSFVSHQVYTTVKPLAVAPLKKSEEPKSFCTPDGKVWYSSFVSHQTYCASKLPACSNEYTVGLPVTANFCGLGWRSAKVVEVNPNGTLNLLYTHGAKEVHVSKKVVRPPFSSFVSHQVYTIVKPPLHWRMMRSTPSHIVSMPSSLNAAPLKLVRYKNADVHPSSATAPLCPFFAYQAPSVSELLHIAKQYSCEMVNFDTSRFYTKARVMEPLSHHTFQPSFGSNIVFKGKNGTIELVNADGSCNVRCADGTLAKNVNTDALFHRDSLIAVRPSS